MTETLLVRTHGGPLPGTRQVNDLPWPLPDTLGVETVESMADIESLADRLGISRPEPVPGGLGYYRKVAESQLPPGLKGVLRGAQYEWVPS